MLPSAGQSHPTENHMNRYRSALLLPLAAGLLALGACTSTQPQANLSSADQTFLENAAQGNRAEIEGSQMALDKATSPEVRQFAQAMIQDHTTANQQLTRLATSKGYTVPTEPSLMQRTELKALSALSGNAFDKMYVDRIGVASHRATVEQFETAATGAQDPDVRAFAQKMLPSLRHHYQMAQTLNERQKAQ